MINYFGFSIYNFVTSKFKNYKIAISRFIFIVYSIIRPINTTRITVDTIRDIVGMSLFIRYKNINTIEVIITVPCSCDCEKSLNESITMDNNSIIINTKNIANLLGTMDCTCNPCKT